LVTRDAQDRGISLRLEATPQETIVRGDGEKLRQAFLNIVINALQATPSGGSVTITVTTSPLPPGGGGLGWGGSGQQGNCCYEITFRDSGAGIAPDDLQRIFEPFYTTKPDGTGLGLAVTRKIIEAHGGTLVVESELGTGTTVVVRLPGELNEE